MRKFFLLIALMISGVGFVNAQNVGDNTIIYYEGYSLQFTITNVEHAECEVRCETQPTSLTSITIPATVEINGAELYVTSVGSSAFHGCDNLQSIEIPSGVTSIGSDAFFSCSYLTTVSFGENSQLTSIGNSAFCDCGNLQSIEIPSGVTSIGNSAFYYCNNLQSIEIPSGVTSIGSEAFSYCYALKSVRCLSEEVPSVGGGVFYNVPSDMQIQVPEISIDAYTVAEPWSNYTITKIYPYHYGESVVEEYEGYSLRFTANPANDGAEVKCETQPTSLTSITIPATVEINGAELDVTSIGSSAFHDCNNLQSIEIPSGVTSIGSYVFYSCSYLTTVSFGENSQLTSIGNSAFCGCNNLQSIEIPSGVTSIGNSAFYDCDNLQSIEIPSGVTSIGNSAFYSCYNLQSIEIPSGVTSIGNSAFYDCNNLQSIEIPSSVTSIGNSAFSYCYALKSVRCLSEEVPSVGGGGFYNVPSDMQIQVPEASIDAYTATEPWSNYTIMKIYPYHYGESVVEEYEGYSLRFTANPANDGAEVRCETQPTSLTSITIPATVEINGAELYVTSVGSSAFHDCDNLQSIEIPSGVTSIGNSAFYSCNNLQSIEIPSGVTSIGNSAFDYCSYLTTVSFGENSQLTSIGNSAFYSCNNLQSIEIPSGVSSIGNSAFSYCYALKSVRCLSEEVPSVGNNIFTDVPSDMQIQVPEASIDAYTATEPWSNYTIMKIYPYHYGESVVEEYEGYSLRFTANPANDGAEVKCETKPTSLTSITIPVTVEINGAELDVTSIGNSAFYDCNNLQSIEIPSGVTSIGNSAFSYCYALKSVRCLSEKVPSVGNNIFTNVPSDMQIQVPEASIDAYTATEPWSNYTIMKIYPYHYGESVVEEYEGYSLRFTANPANDGAEVKCETQPTSLTSITIPATVEINGAELDVTSVGSSAFLGCDNLQSIEIPSGVTSIGNSAFYSCNNLQSIEIPSSVTSIGSSAFYNCSNLERIQFEDESQLTSIGNHAFYNCSSLTSIQIPVSVTIIDNSAFNNCSNLKKVGFFEDSQLTSIGNYAFSYCNNLQSIEIPSGVTSIGNSAFYDCDNLQSIEIPSGVTSMGSGIFMSCYNLETVNFGDNSQLTSIENEAFSYCNNLTSVNFGENSQLTSIGNEVFYSAFTNNTPVTIEIPSSVKSIGNSAFESASVTNVVFGEDSQLTSISNSAFKNCGYLDSIVLPKNVKEIRNFAFQNCGQLKFVGFEDGSQLTSISDLVFKGCNQLQKVEIPSMVNYIGYESFANCGNLIIIENAAVEVPQTDSDAFNACPERMRIQVPAESLEDYKNEIPWNNFTIVSEIIQHEIALSTNLGNTCYTEGAGTYFDGESVTIYAFAYEDWYVYNNYTFAYWSENGEFVSSEANYTFVAESDRNLVANFMNNNYWNPNSGMSSHNMIVTADIQLDGVSANNINIEIGAFCGNELRGNARIQYFETVDKFLYQIVIYGENDDQITFKLYDHNTKHVMEYISHDYLVFTEDATYGSIDEPWEIDFNQKPKIEIEVECNVEEDCNVTGGGEYYQGELVTITAHQVEGLLFQNWTLYGEVVSTDYIYTFTVEEPQRYVANYIYAHDRHLNKGWNWYSTYMQLSGEDGLNTVQSALGSAASQIKSQTAFNTYEQGEWLGALNEYSTEQMYMINVTKNSGYDVTIIGTPVNPSDYSIELNPNWNWVGYPVSANMSISDALANITPKHGDYFKSQTEFSQYYEGSGWLGALQTLEKGKGYMYQNTSAETIELVYPDEVSRSEVKANYSNENNHWIAEIGKYPTNMSITAVVINAGADFEIGTFCNGECRGSARPIYIEQLDMYMIFLTVYGEEGENITFKYYDVISEEIISMSNEAKYAVNATLGSIDDPYVLAFAPTDIDENVTDMINIYPNPVNANSEIHLGTECDNVEIYNALGVKIAEYENVNHIDGIETSGIYMIKIVEQGNVRFNRIVVK